VHLVGFIIRIDRDARLPERQIRLRNGVQGVALCSAVEFICLKSTTLSVRDYK